MVMVLREPRTCTHHTVSTRPNCFPCHTVRSKPHLPRVMEPGAVTMAGRFTPGAISAGTAHSSRCSSGVSGLSDIPGA